MLQEADHGLTSMAMDSNPNANAGDETLLVKFYLHPRKNNAKTEAEGRPIFEEVPYISIVAPGNKDSMIDRPATQRDVDRFPQHYSRFKNRIGDDDQVEGTLLEEWPGISRSQCEELKFFNVRTVEQLAALADSNSQNIMGIQVLKQRAEAYLEASKDEAAAEALTAANSRIDQLTKLVEELTAKVNAQDEPMQLDDLQPAPKKRGRPRKVS